MRSARQFICQQSSISNVNRLSLHLSSKIDYIYICSRDLDFLCLVKQIDKENQKHFCFILLDSLCSLLAQSLDSLRTLTKRDIGRAVTFMPEEITPSYDEGTISNFKDRSTNFSNQTTACVQFCDKKLGTNVC